jgi:hypothetical protein
MFVASKRRSVLLGEAELELELEPRRQLGPPHVTRWAVFEYLTRHPGSSAGAVAAGLGTGQLAVSAHLHHGEGELFVSGDGRWYPVPAADPRARTARSLIPI